MTESDSPPQLPSPTGPPQASSSKAPLTNVGESLGVTRWKKNKQFEQIDDDWDLWETLLSSLNTDKKKFHFLKFF